jgi:tetratricopeptide (TPR) repeat protein
MRALLAAAREREAGVSRRPESAEARSRLSSLGYVGGAGELTGDYGEADDPKRLIALDAMLQEIVSLYTARNLDAAVTKCRDLIRARPSMPLSHMYLAQLERERGDLPAAIDALRKAVALNPRDTTAIAVLGAYLTQAERSDEALTVLTSHGKFVEDDEQVIVARALALASLRRFEESLELLDQKSRQDPDNAMLLIETGTVHLMAGDSAKAQHAFERAVQINPDAARAHISLGVIAVESGNPDVAIRHWQRAVELDVREYDKLLALGVALARAGRDETARPYLEFFVASAPPADHGAAIEKARQWLKTRR